MKNIAILIVFALTGCVVAPPARVVYVDRPAAPVVYQPAPPPPVVSVYIDPPLIQPAPILVEWAPPPMLVERIVPIPYDGAIWTGGYWVWEGNWIWAHGRWSAPPQPGYGWINPYYENRGGSVVFVNGFWAAPGVSFVAPAFSAGITLGAVAIGVVAGPRVIGAPGVFVPAPPGSQPGLVVAAPIGIAPAVVTSAPPILRPGMRIEGNNNIIRNNTTVNNVSNVSNVTNINNVTIVAPAGTTATGQAYAKSVPAPAHLAAALPSVVKSFAPEPVSTKAIPAYVVGRQPVALPPVQVVHAEMTAVTHPRTFADLVRPAAQLGAPSAAAPGSPTSAAAPAALPNALSAQSVKSAPLTPPPLPTPAVVPLSAGTKAPQVTGAVAVTPQAVDPRASKTKPPAPAKPSPAANTNRQPKPQDNAAMKLKEQKPREAMRQPNDGRPKATEKRERE